jgi:hypothetical protein
MCSAWLKLFLKLELKDWEWLVNINGFFYIVLLARLCNIIHNRAQRFVCNTYTNCRILYRNAMYRSRNAKTRKLIVHLFLCNLRLYFSTFKLFQSNPFYSIIIRILYCQLVYSIHRYLALQTSKLACFKLSAIW